ncbi:MAG: aminopeptidase P family protein [Deltaproteobacteria bacterium]|nr:aminopeptidase P family protein [Deltaproteobacteria bacterium]
MENKVYLKRLAELRHRMTSAASAPCDTVWIIQPENRRYFSGFKAEDSLFTESSGSLLINNNRTLLVTDSRYTLEAEKEAVDFEVKTLKQDLADELPGWVQQMGTQALGFEQGYLTWGLHRKVQERLLALSSGVDLIPLNDLAEEMREVKDNEEIGALEDAARLISDVLNEIVKNLKPGMTEKDVAWEIEGLTREAGAEGPSFPPIVASGPNSALPHAVPTDRKLKKNEPVILDLGARLNGYCSDMTRTIFLGDPDPDFRAIYRTVRHAQLAALKDVRPLVESTHLDTLAREIIREAGFGEYFGHGLGHGVGLAVHERPRVGPRNPVKLKKGTVFTIEPGIYVPGKGGVRLEEMVLVQDAGPRILTVNDRFYDF